MTTNIEKLKECIETERKRLHQIIEETGDLEASYGQSVILDQAIEAYIQAAEEM